MPDYVMTFFACLAALVVAGVFRNLWRALSDETPPRWVRERLSDETAPKWKGEE